jgi:outer membrane lipoprotein-sorting protein
MQALRALILLSLALLPACSLPFVRLTAPEVVHEHLENIARYNSGVSQLVAAVDISGTGIFGSLIHEQADLAIKKPHFLLWSLRSFFGPPATIVASDGQFITIFDYFSQTDSTYKKIPFTDDSMFQMFGFAFHPKYLTSLLLAQIPLDKAYEIELAYKENELKITAKLPFDWALSSKFDTSLNRLLETELTNEAARLYYHVEYKNYQENSGIYFPTQHVVTAKNQSKSLRFAVTFSQFKLNGPPIDDDKFYLQDH